MEWKGNFASLTATERGAIESVICEGAAMSYICFNLSQCAVGNAMDEDLILLLRDSYKEFDNRLSVLRKVARKSRRRKATK